MKDYKDKLMVFMEWEFVQRETGLRSNFGNHRVEFFTQFQRETL